MAWAEFRIRMVGPVAIVDVRGLVDETAAETMLEFAAAAATACRAVRIDLDCVDSMTPEAAALLMLPRVSWRASAENVTLRASGRPGRQVSPASGMGPSEGRFRQQHGTGFPPVVGPGVPPVMGPPSRQ
jgi:hypothetical protein